MPRVFLSHSSADEAWVAELYRRLTRDGVDCFYDAESIGWGTNWVKALERAIDECEFVVLVLSPEFCNSEWVTLERTSGLADDPAGLRRKMLPLLLRACQHLPTFPRFLRPIQLMDVSLGSLFEAKYERICRHLGGTVRADFGVVDRTQLPPVDQLPARFRMPYRSLRELFVGRVEPLWRIYDALHRDSTAIVQGVGVVAGTGGLGKSQLAIEYVHRFGQAYPGGVYWIDSERGLSAVLTQLPDAAGIVVDAKAEESVQLEQVWREMNGRPPSLLVLDNFPEEEKVGRYLPPAGRVHTIVTTRRQDLGSHYAQVSLGVLSAEEGMRLLNSGARDFGVEARKLVERLGGLPLALELAKGFLNYRADLGVEAVLRAMDGAREMEVLREFATQYREELPSRHELEVARTFEMSWRLAPEGGKEILRAMAEMAPVPVPKGVLRRIVGSPAEGGLRDSFEQGLAELGRLSLVERDSGGNPFGHRLVLAFVRQQGEAEEGAWARCFEVVNEAMERTFENPGAEAMREMEGLVAHAEALSASGRGTAEQAIRLENAVGWHHRSLGRYAMAAAAMRRALERAEGSLAPGHSLVAIIQSNLALVLKNLGALGEARDLLRSALTALEKKLPAAHASVATIRGNIEVVLAQLESSLRAASSTGE